jgi:hypothetical protein
MSRYPGARVVDFLRVPAEETGLGRAKLKEGQCRSWAGLSCFQARAGGKSKRDIFFTLEPLHRKKSFSVFPSPQPGCHLLNSPGREL